jgi:hypothetical protein
MNAEREAGRQLRSRVPRCRLRCNSMLPLGTFGVVGVGWKNLSNKSIGTTGNE